MELAHPPDSDFRLVALAIANLGIKIPRDCLEMPLLGKTEYIMMYSRDPS
jgi:hypothetical protein